MRKLNFEAHVRYLNFKIARIYVSNEHTFRIWISQATGTYMTFIIYAH